MLDLRLFGDRRFSVASAGITLTFFCMFGTFFLLAQVFQLVLGFSPLKAGLMQLPFSIVLMSVSPQVPKLVERFGSHVVGAVGSLLVAAMLVLFSMAGPTTSIGCSIDTPAAKPSVSSRS